MCESRGGRPGLPVPNSPYVLSGHKAALNLTELKHKLEEEEHSMETVFNAQSTVMVIQMDEGERKSLQGFTVICRFCHEQTWSENVITAKKV